MNRDAVEACYETIQVHSKSFAMASKLLPRDVRDRAVVVYAWCRRADDAVDLAGRQGAAEALAGLERELDAVYGAGDIDDPTVTTFREVAHECGIPAHYPRDLLEGMRMDVADTRYDTMDRLYRYCYCVAGTVGLMMCHVMGVSDESATRNAVHLGMAMQVTNICRDVLEDWNMGRLYIPDELLDRVDATGLASRLGRPFPDDAAEPVSRAIASLLDDADAMYESGDRGLNALSWRCALSVRTARRVYSAIGARVRAAGCDPRAGRAWVSKRGKLALAAGAFAEAIAEAPDRAGSAARIAAPERVVEFPRDILPV